ncbi:MAG: triose-phosphate isomerase [Pseudomonadota bacterium]|nr:triose-phosphate isomerase [Pseudomonadota bacterium]
MDNTRSRLIVGNWKMHGSIAFVENFSTELLKLALGIKAINIELVLCPPNPYLKIICDIFDSTTIFVGGQDCHADMSGAYTGDVSAEMLVDVGCKYVITGHSERREQHGEHNSLVRRKTTAAQTGGLIPILCVGEKAEDRERGAAVETILRQLKECVPEGSRGRDIVVAYEPVWAIGTGKIPKISEIAEVHGAIRDAVNKLVSDPDALRILYGGSVKPENAQDILSVSNVDGALVGGASLKTDEFWRIVKAYHKE